MSVRIRIHRVGSASGVIRYHVVPPEGGAIGTIEHTPRDGFTARVPNRLQIVWDGAAVELPTLSDSASPRAQLELEQWSGAAGYDCPSGGCVRK